MRCYAFFMGRYHKNCRKQVEPVSDMWKIAAPLSAAWKVIVKAFRPVLYALHCPFNDAFLIR